MNKIKRCAQVGGKHFLFILMSFIAVFPVYWMILTSFRGEGEIYSWIPWLTEPTIKNYVYAFQAMPLLKMMGISVIVAVLQAVFQLATAVFAAYALMRWEFKGKTLVYGCIAFTWLIPFQAIMVPNYILINQLHLNGNLWAIVLPHMASSFAILSLFSSFNSFPHALVDASRMDGSGELQTLKNIVLPNMKASISSLGILIFINSWNDYMWPMLVSRDPASAPIQIGLKSFIASETNMWGSLMATATLSCIPIMILYLFLQKNVVDSFMKWGIK